MDEIEQIGIAMDFTLSERKCAFHGCGDKAVDVYVADFSNGTEKITLAYPVCGPCLEAMRDVFSPWLPIFCVRCSSAAWIEKKNGKVEVQDGASVVFMDGCPRCAQIADKVWCL